MIAAYVAVAVVCVYALNVLFGTVYLCNIMYQDRATRKRQRTIQRLRSLADKGLIDYSSREP